MRLPTNLILSSHSQDVFFSDLRYLCRVRTASLAPDSLPQGLTHRNPLSANSIPTSPRGTPACMEDPYPHGPYSESLKIQRPAKINVIPRHMTCWSYRRSYLCIHVRVHVIVHVVVHAIVRLLVRRLVSLLVSLLVRLFVRRLVHVLVLVLSMLLHVWTCRLTRPVEEITLTPEQRPSMEGLVQARREVAADFVTKLVHEVPVGPGGTCCAVWRAVRPVVVPGLPQVVPVARGVAGNEAYEIFSARRVRLVILGDQVGRLF